MIDNSRGAFACPSHFVDSDPRFLSILTRFVDYYSPFWGPKAISMVVEPQVHLSVGHQQSQFGPILSSFLDYYLVMGVPK